MPPQRPQRPILLRPNSPTAPIIILRSIYYFLVFLFISSIPKTTYISAYEQLDLLSASAGYFLTPATIFDYLNGSKQWIAVHRTGSAILAGILCGPAHLWWMAFSVFGMAFSGMVAEVWDVMGWGGLEGWRGKMREGPGTWGV